MKYSYDLITFLKIYDGPTTSSPVIFDQGGFSIPASVRTQSNVMLVVFTSDGEATSSGFLAEYTSVSQISG